MFTVSPADGVLRVVDPLTAATLRAVPLFDTTNQPVVSCNGLAVHPVTGQLWALVRTTGSVRRLATVDPATGLVTVIGATSDSFAGIAFRSDGVLLAVTGDGATVPETLYRLDTTTAASTVVCALGNGTDGEAIAFVPQDGFLYHCSGLGVPDVDEVFERVDTDNGATTAISLAGFHYREMLGLTSWVGGNLLGADLDNELMVINTRGQVTRIGTLDHSAKGIAFRPSLNTTPFVRGYGNGCQTSSGEVPLLWTAGSPALGSSFSLELRLIPPTAFGLLGIGNGTGALPIPSPQCQAQISPPAGTVGFFSTPAGAATFLLTVPAALGASDFYFQAGILDGSSFAVSNPLQVHAR